MVTPEERLKQLEEILPDLLEAAEDLRLYAPHWATLKYGDRWDEVIARANATVRRAT